MIRSRRRRRVVRTAAALGAVGTLIGGPYAIAAWEPFADPGAAWDERVEPLVRFVERVTGVTFVEPVPVDFVSKGEFTDIRAQQRANDGLPNGPADLTEDERQYLSDAEATGRALGMWSGSFDLMQTELALFRAEDDSAVTLDVSDDGEIRRIIVRSTYIDPADDPNTDVVHRVDLVNVLAVTLAQQRFDLLTRRNSATDQATAQVADSLLRGFVGWTTDEYISRLSPDDEADYWFSADSDTNEFFEAVSLAPAAFRLDVYITGSAGTAFIGTLRESNDVSLAEVLSPAGAPTTLDQIVLPIANYVERDPLEPLDQLTAPAGAERVTAFTLEPHSVYSMLAGAVPAHVALEATDGWGNAQAVRYQLDGRGCIDGAIVGDSRADTTRLADALQAWAAERPDDADALFARSDELVTFSVCDPGVRFDVEVASSGEVDHYLGRFNYVTNSLRTGGEPDEVECRAVGLFQQISLGEAATLFDPATEAAAAVLESELREQCDD
jgi:hypothetical protein